MIRFGKIALAVTLTCSCLMAQPDKKEQDRAAAFYNYTMGRVYAELAGAYGNKGEYVNKAIDHFKLVLKADPSATFITEDISDLYVQGGRIQEAVREAVHLRIAPYEGGIVLDPFSGTGTTNYVAFRLGRKSVGIDVSEEYINAASERCRLLL